ncbi:hypothetical protein LXL04_037057 [Taraxacum kok-saghyz]
MFCDLSKRLVPGEDGNVVDTKQKERTFACNLSLKSGTAYSCKFVSCSCLVRVVFTRIKIRVVFVFAKFVSCKFVYDTNTRHVGQLCTVFFFCNSNFIAKSVVWLFGCLALRLFGNSSSSSDSTLITPLICFVITTFCIGPLKSIRHLRNRLCQQQ